MLLIAAPSCPEPFLEEHPDGGARMFRQRGDEFFSWVEDDTGAVFTRDAHRKLAHAEVANNRLVPRTRPRARPLQREEAEALASEAPRETSLMSFASLAPLASTPALPPRNLLVIVVGFSDIAPTSTSTTWEQRIFDANGKTVNTYYRAVSKNQFWFQPAANNGVVFVTLSSAHPNPSGNESSSAPSQPAVREALAQAALQINFKNFDANANNKIDAEELALLFIFAGYESSRGGSSTPKVWAHFSRLNLNPVLCNGVEVGGGGYAVMGERHGTGPGDFASIGVPCHELGHSLGLRDLYDTSGASHGIGGHGLMGEGNWGRVGSSEQPGATPVFMCAHSRCLLGFTEPEEITNGARPLEPASLATLAHTEVLKIPTASPTEYFLVENRQLAGFDQGLQTFFGSGATAGGIAIWHIDETIANNNNPAHKFVDLEEANEAAVGLCQLDVIPNGNQGRREHYFYAGNNTNLNAATTPNSLSHNNLKPTGVHVNIETDLSVTVKTTRPGVPSNLTATSALPNRVALAWQAAPLATSYNIYRFSNYASTLVLVGSTSATSHDDFTAQPGLYYTYQVAAQNDGAESALSASATGWVTPWPLALAAGPGAGGFVWTTGGNAPWYGQKNYTREGISLQSGRIADNQQTWIQTTVYGPGFLKFYLRIDCETNYDKLDVLVNGKSYGYVTGWRDTSWQPVLFELPEGSYTFRWVYSKNPRTSTGQDAGWLDSVAFFMQSTNTPVPVPYDWLDDYFPDLNPNLTAPLMGANGVRVWESYVAGLDPTDPKSVFHVNIALTNDIPYISWKPNLGKDRVYTIEGKTNLSDAAWCPTNSATRFFRARVDMPK